MKIHRSYAVDEAARVLKVHKHTIRGWLKKGLSPIDAEFPILIHGQDLRNFLEQKKQSARKRCPPGHIYCLRCRAPKFPAGQMADYIPVSSTKGLIRAICPDCGSLINRLTSLAKLGTFEAHFEISFPQGRERIIGST